MDGVGQLWSLSILPQDAGGGSRIKGRLTVPLDLQLAGHERLLATADRGAEGRRRAQQGVGGRDGESGEEIAKCQRPDTAGGLINLWSSDILELAVGELC